MKFTNTMNLPQGIFDAIKRDSYSIGEANYSISNLNTPPQNLFNLIMIK